MTISLTIPLKTTIAIIGIFSVTANKWGEQTELQGISDSREGADSSGRGAGNENKKLSPHCGWWIRGPGIFSEGNMSQEQTWPFTLLLISIMSPEFPPGGLYVEPLADGNHPYVHLPGTRENDRGDFRVA